MTAERARLMPRSLVCWVSVGSQKSSYSGSGNAVCEFPLNHVLICRAGDDKGNCSARGHCSNWGGDKTFWGATRHWLLHITWWFPWETPGEGQGMGKWCVNNFKILENWCLCFAWCWTDSPGRKTAAIQSIIPTKSCHHASPLSRLDRLPGHEHTTSHTTHSLSYVSCEAARL